VCHSTTVFDNQHYHEAGCSEGPCIAGAVHRRGRTSQAVRVHYRGPLGHLGPDIGSRYSNTSCCSRSSRSDVGRAVAVESLQQRGPEQLQVCRK
jgi:hypothetical protein